MTKDRQGEGLRRGWERLRKETYRSGKAMGKTVPERGTDMGWVEKALGWRAPEQNWAPRNHMEWLQNEAGFHGELGKSVSVLCTQNPRPFNETNKDIHASLGP